MITYYTHTYLPVMKKKCNHVTIVEMSTLTTCATAEKEGEVNQNPKNTNDNITMRAFVFE